METKKQKIISLFYLILKRFFIHLIVVLHTNICYDEIHRG